MHSFTPSWKAASGAFAAEVLEIHPVGAEVLAAGQGAIPVPGLPAQDGAHAQKQLPHLEGLAQVIVTACLEAVDAIILGILGGEKEDGGEVLRIPHPLADGESVHARQHHVQDHQVVIVMEDALEGLVAPGDPLAGQAFHFEIELDALGQAQFVFDQ